MREIDTIAVHCADTKPNMDIGAAELDAWHKARKWPMIGYHYVIRRDGTLEKGRPLDMPGAHVKGHNAHSIGICLVGGMSMNGKPENNFTEAQFGTLRKLFQQLRLQFPTIATIQGHRDFPQVAKACPCFDVKAWLRGDADFEDRQTPAYQEEFWAGIDYFRPSEFAGVAMDLEYIRRLDAARHVAGVPFVVEKVISPTEVLIRVRGE